jgi:hypothetical protein
MTPEEVALSRTVGLTAFTVPLFLVASLAAGCTGRQDGEANTAANPPPPNYGAQGGYGPPPGGAPPPGGYNNPPPGGYNNPPPGGYNNPPPGGYGNPAPSPAPGSYGNPAPAPGGYNPGPFPPPYTPPPSSPPANPSPSPAPSNPPPASSGGGFPWPFPAPGTPPQGGGSGGSTSGSTGSATPIDPNLASVATVPLMAYAQQEAAGMTREGGVVAGQFKEGQTLEQPIQILPGKCYAVLAVGAGIQEMDITLVATTPIPQATPILAQDQGSGASASLGGRGQCFKWGLPFGINAKFVLKATRGQGVAAGQLYVK